MTKSCVESLTLAWDDVICTANPRMDFKDRIRHTKKPKKTILRGVSGLAEPGCLTALMGPSGAGKTSLMNILTQRNLSGLEIQGKVMLNGVPISNIRSYNKMVGFIQQYDLLPGGLTVREYLNFTVSLLYGRSMTKAERDRKVESTIQKVSLGKCENTLIGGRMTSERISGGERKRVCIASQLLNDPGVLVLDEPTTGMDAYLAELLVRILQDLAYQGYTILCTIHQPSSEVFLRFDRLILLADGRKAYVGSRDKAVNYFSYLGFTCPDNYLPADYFIDLLTRKPGLEGQTTKTIECLCDQYDQSMKKATVDRKLDREYKRGKSPEQMKKFASGIEKRKRFQALILTQFLVVLMREFKGIARMPERFIGQSLATMVTCTAFLGVFWNPTGDVNQGYINNTFGALGIFVIFIGGGLNVMGMVGAWTDMLPLVVKECKDGIYKAPVYYVAAVTTESTFGTLQLLIAFFPLYYGAGLHHTQHDFAVPLQVWMAFLLSTFICIAFSSMLIFLAERAEVCIDLFNTVFTIFVMFNGYFINIRSIDSGLTEVIRWFDWMPWVVQWVQVLQWEDVTDIECEVENELTCLKTGEEVLYKFGFQPDKAKNAGLMMGQLALYHTLALAVLLIKMRYKFAG